ncbi:MAG: hypothetical protein HXS47_07585, partial [Theionarchaea archaeon]|nr:hypothetical protein [Theionarchaea archaeon]
MVVEYLLLINRGRIMTDQCPECGSVNLYHDYERAEVICSDCGLVVNET